MFPMSISNQPSGNGWVVTKNGIGLLLFILGAASTSRLPDVAPLGIVNEMEVPLQKLTVIDKSFKVTSPVPWDEPKPVPTIETRLPTEPVVPEVLVITGAGIFVEFTDTLSNVAVAKDVVVASLTARPT